MCKKLMYVISVAVLLIAAGGVRAAVLEITPDAPVLGDLDIANLVGSVSDIDNIGEGSTGVYDNDVVTYVAHDRGGQGQTFITGDSDVPMTGVWVRHVLYSTAPDTTWYRMQPGGQLQIRITNPAASGTDAFVLASETYDITGEEENALPATTTNDATGTGLWIHVILDTPVVLAANTEYGFDLTSISGLSGVLFFETMGIRDAADGGNPYADGSAYVSGAAGVADNVLTPAPGDRVFVVELGSRAKLAPTHSYTFEDGTANDIIGGADGVLVGGAVVADGALVTTAQDQWMEMPGDVIAMNTYSEVTIEAFYTPTAGANTSWSMLAYFGDSTDPDPSAGVGNDGFFITSARGDDKSRAAISIGDPASPWASETGADGPELDDGLAHYMASTINATDITLYIDGELIASTPLAAHNSIAGISTNYALLAKGGYGGDPEWIGAIDEFNIYNVALSAGQIAANYAKGPDKGMTHSYTFEDGTAKDSIGGADGVLVGGAAIVGGALVTTAQDQWMEMPGDVIAMNTYSEVTIEAFYTPTAGANTSWSMLAYFGDSTDPDPSAGVGNDGFFITSARGDDKSRAAISIGDPASPWASETGADGPEYDDGLAHYMASTINATDITLYIDGELIASTPLAAHNSIAGISTNYALLAKGGYGGDPEWIGEIEEFNIYNKALSAEDIAASYAGGPNKVGAQPVDPGTDGLLAYYPLDSAGRSITKDASGNGNDGTIVGDPVFVANGVVGNALDFNGNDYVNCGNNPLFAMDTNQMTVATWVTIRSIPDAWRAAVAKGENAWRLGNVNLDPRFHFGITIWNAPDAASVDGVTAVGLNEWHHVAGTFDGANISVYLDGVVDATIATTVPIGTNTLGVFIGDNPEATGRFWDGAIDEVYIYNRALSDLEVQFLAGL